MEIKLGSESAMIAFGVQCAQCIRPGMVDFLDGDQGAGKTTLCKGLLSGWGYPGVVTSPTFTLLEAYELDIGSVQHFDLYRMETPEELEMIGARELFNPSSICLIEWPEKAAGFLPDPDLHLTISHLDDGRLVRLDGRAKAEIELCLQSLDHD